MQPNWDGNKLSLPQPVFRGMLKVAKAGTQRTQGNGSAAFLRLVAPRPAVFRPERAELRRASRRWSFFPPGPICCRVIVDLAIVWLRFPRVLLVFDSTRVWLCTVFVVSGTFPFKNRAAKYTFGRVPVSNRYNHHLVE